MFTNVKVKLENSEIKRKKQNKLGPDKFIYVQYRYIMTFTTILYDVTKFPLYPKNFMNCSLVKLRVKLDTL